MSVVELFALIRRSLKIFLIAAVLGIAASCAYVFLQPVQYSATANIVVSESPTSMTAFLQGYDAPEGVKVSCSADSRTKTVKVIATGADAERCIQAANDASSSLISDAKIMYPKKNFMRYAAENATEVSRNLVKYALAGLFAGLAVAFVVVMVRWARSQQEPR